MNDVKDLTLIIRSRMPLVVVETDEESRLLELLEQVARLEGKALFVWTAVDGLYRRSNPLAVAPGSYSVSATQKGAYGRTMIPETRAITGALKHIHATPQNGIYVLLDVHPYLDDPVNARIIKSTAQEYEKNPRTLVLVGHKLALPDDLRQLSASFALKLPDAQAVLAQREQEAEHVANGASSGKLRGTQEARDLVTQ